MVSILSMFEQTFVADAGTRNPWTVIAGLTGQLFALGLMILMPLVYTDRIPVFRFVDLHIFAAGWPSSRAAAGRYARELRNRSRRNRDSSIPTSSSPIPESRPRRSISWISYPPPPPCRKGPYVPGAVYDPNAVSTGIPFSIGKALPPPPEAENRSPQNRRRPSSGAYSAWRSGAGG